MYSYTPVGFQKSACASDLGDRVLGRLSMIVCRVGASALLDLPAASEPAVIARPLVGVLGRRTTGAASRSRRVAQSQPHASDGLGGSSGVRRARPSSAPD